MNRDYRRAVVGGAAVAATFAVIDVRRFGSNPVELAAGCIALFVIFFALFLRNERKGSMMSPLWMGVFGIVALSYSAMDWSERVPSGIALVVDVAFMAMFAVVAVIGIKAWVQEERQRNQRRSA